MSSELPPISSKEAVEFPSWQEWYKNAVEKKGRDVKRVSLENEDWQVVKGEDGEVKELVHKNKLFFTGVGIDAGWKQPFLEPVVDPEDPNRRQGIVVLFVDEKTGDMLLNAEFEIGARAQKGVSIRPTIQCSYSNIRNSGYPFSELFVANNIPEFESRMKAKGGTTKNEMIDPGRIGNYNLYGLLPIDKEIVDLSDKPFHRWFTQQELGQLRGQGDLLTNQFSVTNEMRLNWMLEKQTSIK